MKGKLTMKTMLGMLMNLLDSLDQIVIEEAKQVLGVLRDLLMKLNGENGITLLEELKKFLRKETCWVMTAFQRLVAAGKYDYVNMNIDDNKFSIPEDFVLGADPKVFHFDRYISSEDVVKEMNKNGYRPAKIWDLLDYGSKNPEEQRKFPIVCLGSLGNVLGLYRVLCLDSLALERRLDLGWWDRGWFAYYRFLAVRKEVSQTSVS